MCNFVSLKRIVPFAITFVIGLFVASLFYGFTATKTSNNHHYKRIDKNAEHNRTHCYNEQMDFESDLNFAVPEVSEIEEDVELKIEDVDEVRIIEPTLRETIIINEQTEEFSK